MLVSKSIQYIEKIGKNRSELPSKFTENLDLLDELADIYKEMEAAGDTAGAAETKSEFDNADQVILAAMEKEYPGEAAKPVEKTAPKKKPAAKAKKTSPPATEIPMPPLDADGNRRIDDAALDALEKHLAGLPQTKKLHTTKTGNYTAARKKLHDKIIDHEFKDSTCIRRAKPIAILTGGLPGSGKSTFIKNNRDWLTNRDLFKIDSDEVRAQFPEYKGWNAAQTHEEARDIVDRMIEKLGSAGCSYDVIYDGTMNKARKYKPLVDKLKKEGYEVYILYMKVDRDTSMKRVLERYQATGRYVPRFVIEETAAAGLDTFNKLKTEVAGYVLVDGVTQEVIEKGGKEIPSDRNYRKLCCEDEAEKPAAKPEEKPAYSWKTATPVEKLKPVVLHCQHYHLPVEAETRVTVKGTGQEGMQVTARPGEHLIFDDKGYLVYVMNGASFGRKCNEGQSVDQHKEPAEGKKKPAAKITRKKKPVKAKAAKPKAEPPKPAESKPEKAPVSEKKEKSDDAGEELAKMAAKLQKARDEQKKYTRSEIIRIGKEIQPTIQSAGGVKRDVNNKNRRVLAPTLDNLLRWVQKPGQYDLVGVDIARDAEPTVVARLSKKAKIRNLMGIK